ncbi:Pecanex protein [Fasciola gigantica]|uniref:Pecanex-like protein n=1 Tax=Fasciola gigantica TaxID=46835 RepID=A0A504YPM4_FASGI|nr:Pecanex protein [Fasciola gigantica]
MRLSTYLEILGFYGYIIFVSHSFPGGDLSAWFFSLYLCDVSDFLLAQLIGVHSLADAGLTRQECVAQLRGCLDGEDSENAELDILFALMAAATNVDGASTEAKNAWDKSANQSEWVHISEEHQSSRARNIQQQQQPQQREPVAGPSTSFTPRAPTLDSNAIVVERVSSPPVDLVDVQLSHALESQSSTRNRRSIPQTRPFFRSRPLSGAARIRTQSKQIYMVRPFPLLPITLDCALIGFNWTPCSIDWFFHCCSVYLSRSRSVLEPILSVVLSLLVGIAGLSVLQTGVYRDLSVLSLCFAIAGSHYSLIKSVQPDAASPQHGFNRVIVYSRAIFFCLLALAFILTTRYHDWNSTNPYGIQSPLFLSTGLPTNELSLIDRSWFLTESSMLPIEPVPFRIPEGPELPVYRTVPPPVHSLRISNSDVLTTNSAQVKLFGSAWSIEKLAHIVHIVTSRLLVIFPLLFLLGLIPQIDTALTYMLEQMDIHVFGGSGTVSLWSVCLSILRTLIAIAISLWFCLAAIETGDPYHCLFSVFWALQVPLCFLLSRLPSNVSLYATLFPCSVSGEQFGQKLRLLASEFFDFSCFSRITHKSAMRAPIERSKRCCRPRWPWSKARKSKVGVIGAAREPVVWWRAWLPLLSNVGVKSASRLSAAQATATERLLGHPLEPVGKVPTAAALFPVPLISTYPTRACKSFSFSDLLSIDPTQPASKTLATCLPTASSLPLVSMFSGRTVLLNPKNQTDLHKSQTSLHSPEATERVQSDDSVPSRVSSAPANGRNQLNDVHSTDFHPRLSTAEPCPQVSAPNPAEELSANLFGPDLPSPSKVSSPTLLQHHRSTLSDSEVSSDSKQPGIPQSSTDPLPELIRVALTERLKNDLNCCVLWFVVIAGLHASPLLMYATKQPIFSRIVLWTLVSCGIFLHYISPNLRKVPILWLCLARPPVAPHAYGELIRWETGYYWFCWLERNFLIPFLTVLTVTQSVTTLIAKFGPHGAAVLVLLTSMKMLRNGFCAPSRVFITLFFTDLLFTFDFHPISETFPVNYFFVSFLVNKVHRSSIENCIFVYNITRAPFRITCGSVFHAIAQNRIHSSYPYHLRM